MGKVIMSGIVPSLVAPEPPVKGILGSDLAVGSSVYLNVNGTATEFLIVNQGIPGSSSLYDSSCNGIWLLMKDVYETSKWYYNSQQNSYKDSIIHSYLNDTFLNLLDENIREQIKSVKIPYVNGSGGSAVASGSSGLDAKIFLLSGYELGWTQSDQFYFPIDGAKLEYFESGTGTSANSKRIAYLIGAATGWWLRSPFNGNSMYVRFVTTSGSYMNSEPINSFGIRPAFVLPSTSMFDPETLLFMGVA